MRRARLTIIAALLAAFAFSVVPAASSADVVCGLAGDELMVDVSDGFAPTIVRSGDDIVVEDGGGPVDCDPAATVDNTDRVNVDELGPDVTTQSEIDLSGGGFEPGATNESDDTDEIEFRFFDIENVSITGSILADHLRFGSVSGEPRANLNAGDEGGSGLFADADVQFTGLERIRVFAGGSPDVASGQSAVFNDSPFALPLTLHGEAGNDVLTGGAGDDSIGAPAEPGSDTLTGGAGSDFLPADAGNDGVDGGPGTDTASYLTAPSAVTVDLARTAQQNTGGGGLDTVRAVENLLGSQSGDTFRGTGSPNKLEGLAGGDLIEGRGGADTVLGDTAGSPPFGNDRLLVRDGIADFVSCLGGVDSVTADQQGVDAIPADCENVAFAAAPPPPPIQTPPPSNEFSFGKAKKKKRNGTAKLPVEVPGAGGLELAQSKRVKAAEARAEAEGEVQLKVKPKGKAKKKLAETGKAKVNAEVSFTPDGGEPNTATTKVKLVKK